MTRPSLPDRPDQSQFIQHIGKLRIQLNGIQSQMMPEALAERTGTQFVVETGNSGKYIFEILEQEVCLVYPEWVVKDSLSNKDLPPTTQALVLFYFITADGTSPDGRWISFSNLPDGRFYNPAYQGYTGGELAKNFQNDLEAFGKAARQLGGVNWATMPEVPGDVAYRFQTLPRLAVLSICWEGDEDFPTSYRILFESTASHYLPTDVCAYLGSFLTRSLVKAKPADPTSN